MRCSGRCWRPDGPCSAGQACASCGHLKRHLDNLGWCAHYGRYGDPREDACWRFAPRRRAAV